MERQRLERLLKKLGERLASEPVFADDVTCNVEFFVNKGGLMGDVIITKRLRPSEDKSKPV